MCSVCVCIACNTPIIMKGIKGNCMCSSVAVAAHPAHVHAQCTFSTWWVQFWLRLIWCCGIRGWGETRNARLVLYLRTVYLCTWMTNGLQAQWASTTSKHIKLCVKCKEPTEFSLKYLMRANCQMYRIGTYVRNIIIGCLPNARSSSQSTKQVNWIRLKWLWCGILEDEDISMWIGNDCYLHVCVREFLPISWNLSSHHRFDKIRRFFFCSAQFMHEIFTKMAKLIAR